MSEKSNDDLKRQASENTLGLNPIVGIQSKDLLTSARTVLTQAIRQPFHSAKHVAHFAVALKNSRRLTSPTNSIVTFPSVSSVIVTSQMNC